MDPTLGMCRKNLQQQQQEYQQISTLQKGEKLGATGIYRNDYGKLAQASVRTFWNTMGWDKASAEDTELTLDAYRVVVMDIFETFERLLPELKEQNANELGESIEELKGFCTVLKAAEKGLERLSLGYREEGKIEDAKAIGYRAKELCTHPKSLLEKTENLLAKMEQRKIEILPNLSASQESTSEVNADTPMQRAISEWLNLRELSGDRLVQHVDHLRKESIEKVESKTRRDAILERVKQQHYRGYYNGPSFIKKG